MYAIGLNTVNDLQYLELVALGALNKVAIDPVELFHLAVNKKCKKIVLIHNHPSGDLNPSRSDLEFTKEMIKAGEILRITIVDHLIISETEYRSCLYDALIV